MGTPQPRPEVWKAYWSLATERQNIWRKRLLGTPAPWTEDKILQEYKFTNAYRANDRVSQFLLSKVIYDQQEREEADLLLRILLFRIFSRNETWLALEEKFGDINSKSFSAKKYGQLLDGRMEEGTPVFTNAFILCANSAYGHQVKHRNWLALVEKANRKQQLARQVSNAKSLEEVYNVLLGYPLLGPFMAYQIAIDLNYSPLTDFSENDFVAPGPGALRGLKKCFLDDGGLNTKDLIRWTCEGQVGHYEELGISFPNLFGRDLQLIDCQNLFCETDKYCRVAFPELASARTRIKTRFRVTGDLDRPVYPPKWGLESELDKFFLSER